MTDLSTHYRLLLGLDETWRVADVHLSMEENRVVIQLEHCGGKLSCPECGKSCSQSDLAPERSWRHLDTMQFETVLKARIPRCQCDECGVKTTAVSWAEKHSRFTMMFEAFAIEVLKACSNVERARVLLRLTWERAHAILQRAVDRGLKRRSTAEVEHVGMDEKSFLKGQSYVTLMTDIGGQHVLDVSEGRTEESADELWEKLPETRQKQIKAVAMDMWPAYINSAQAKVPDADIVHDKFHIAKHLNEAVDQVRRAENKQLRAQQDDTLTGSRQLWLFNEKNLSDRQLDVFTKLKNQNLKTSKAWALKEQLRSMWTYCSRGWAQRYFSKWYDWATRSQLRPYRSRCRAS